MLNRLNKTIKYNTTRLPDWSIYRGLRQTSPQLQRLVQVLKASQIFLALKIHSKIQAMRLQKGQQSVVYALINLRHNVLGLQLLGWILLVSV